MTAVEDAAERAEPVADRDPDVPLDGAEPVPIPTARGLAGGLLAAVARPRPLAREAVKAGPGRRVDPAGHRRHRPVGAGQALRRPGVGARTRCTGGWRRPT